MTCQLAQITWFRFQTKSWTVSWLESMSSDKNFWIWRPISCDTTKSK